MVTDIDPAANAFWIANGFEAKRYEYKLDKDSVVIDLGAFQGEFAIGINNLYGCRVICVEPTGSANFMEKFDWCTVINKAAYIDERIMSFGGNSYYTSHYENGTQQYPTFDVADLIHPFVSLLKINVEGMEYDIMRHIIKMNLHLFVKNFQIQFHQIPNYQIYYDYIRHELSKTHDKIWGVDWVWENWSLR